MQHNPAFLLFPGYRRRVLALLLLRPDESLHCREIARQAGLPAGTIARELTRLAQAGLLRRERRGNQVLYSANKASPIFAELASILRKTSGLSDVLAEALSTVEGDVRVAFVYGSVARGEATTGSDIDLMVIGNATLANIVRALAPAQSTLGREINPKGYRAAEWKARIADSDPFVADVLARPMIFVMGNAGDLEELGGDKPGHGDAVAGHDVQTPRRRSPATGGRKGRRT